MEVEDLTQDQRDRLIFLNHIPNNRKSDEQWQEYLDFYEMMDWEEPDRNQWRRPLYYPEPKKKKHEN